MTEDQAKIIATWWRRLNPERAKAPPAPSAEPARAGAQKRGPNLSGERARLRRCQSAHEIVLESEYHRLRRELDGSGPVIPAHVLAHIALVLAHVRVDGKEAFASACGRASDSGKPAVSELRFTRLLRSRELDALAPQVRRVLPMIDHTANIRQLARDMSRWDHAQRNRWAEQYYDHKTFS